MVIPLTVELLDLRNPAECLATVRRLNTYKKGKSMISRQMSLVNLTNLRERTGACV